MPRVQRSESQASQVARNIRNDIEAGRLRDGEVLPSQRQLSEHWGVSTHTISEAMRQLSAEGLVVSAARSRRVVHAPDQAQRREIRPAEPHVVLIGGWAGSGKTELGRILVRETGWPLLDKDTISRPVLESALAAVGYSPHDRESDLYLTQFRPREYEALAAAVHENVECGNSVLATAPFVREMADPAWIARARATYAALNASLTLVWVHCDEATMHTYLRHRGAARDAYKLAHWDEYMAQIDLDFRPPAPHIAVDNSESSLPLHDQARKLLESIPITVTSSPRPTT